MTPLKIRGNRVKRLEGKVREERENGMLRPVSVETPMECHGESAGIRAGAVVRSLGPLGEMRI